jgi:hypothetical protein
MNFYRSSLKLRIYSSMATSRVYRRVTAPAKSPPPPPPPTRGCVVLYQGEEVDDYYGGERGGAVYDRGYIIECVGAVHRGYK